MKKLKLLLSLPHFWIYFLANSLIIAALETIMLGLWTVPILNYRIDYMDEVTRSDLLFVGIFALIFGFGTALFLLMRKNRRFACTLGTGSLIGTFFTLLCPVCPIFFLSLFGLSATVSVFAPYFWWIRLAAILLAFTGTLILWKKSNFKKLPAHSSHIIFQKFAIIIIALLFINNQALATVIGHELMGPQAGGKVKMSGDFSRDIAALVTPTSLPFYGPELGLDFSGVEQINASIKKMAVMAPMQGSNPIQLNEEEMKRYIAIGTEPTVTCEFCCGVKTLVREDGSPTCGCAHSIGMRGTAAYLIKNYPEMSNAEIAYELMRQKGMYFPKQMQERMAKELAGEASAFTPDIKYLTLKLKPEELEKLQKKAKKEGFVPDVNEGMVGGC